MGEEQMPAPAGGGGTISQPPAKVLKRVERRHQAEFHLVRLYIEDIEEILGLLRTNDAWLSVTAGDFKITTAADLEHLQSNYTTLRICRMGGGANAEIEISPFRSYVCVDGSPTPEVMGLFGSLSEIVRRGEKRYGKLLEAVSRYSLSWSVVNLVVSWFAHHAINRTTAFFSWIALATGLVTGIVLFLNRSYVVTEQRTKPKAFVTADNRDKVILVLITTLVNQLVAHFPDILKLLGIK